MLSINSPILTQMSETSYKTINYKNKNIPFTTQNKQLNKKISSKFFNLTIKNKNSDEDDTKNNQNFRIFMDNLFKKEEDINNEISSIHSNKVFLLKEKDYNTNKNLIHSRNKQRKFLTKKSNTTDNNKFNELYKNEIDKRSIGSECNIINFFKDKRNKNGRNYTFRKENSLIGNTTQNIQTFSFQEFDGKMLSKIKENNYFKKLEKIQKKHKKINSYNCIRKIIPQNIIPRIMFQANNIIKREKENKLKLMAMKENAILFLKDKTNKMNKNNEIKNSINSYGFTNEKTNITLNKNHLYNINKFPLIKLKIFYNDKNSNKYMKQLEIKDRFWMNMIEINKKNF